MDFGFGGGRRGRNHGPGGFGGGGGFGNQPNQYDQFNQGGFNQGGFNQGYGGGFGGEGQFDQGLGSFGNQGYGNEGYGNPGFNPYGSGQGGFGGNQGGFQGGLAEGFNQGFNNNNLNNVNQEFGQNFMNQFAAWFKQDPNVQTGFQIRDKVVEELLYQPGFMEQRNDWEAEKKRNNNSTIRGDDTNILNLISKQVVMIESCPLQQKIEELKAQGRKYEDTVFPANLKSLTGEHGAISSWNSIQWKAASSIVSKCRLFDELIHPNDIKQGKLGDCYLLAALAALAEQPQRILNLFLIDKENAQGYYVCKILYKGKWKTIDLDEMIPAIGSSPAFSKADNQELWVVMLEKAWAKLYASYKRIEAGYPQEGLHDLTGAHIRAIRLKTNFNKQSEWDYLTDATERKFAMIASSQPGSDTNIAASGIVDGHAYTFLGAYDVEFSGRVERLCKLRNPWGKSEATGKWNDSDSRWNQINPSEIQRIGYTKKEDGIFFMTYDDFVANFRMLTVAEINDNASYIYSTQKSTAAVGNYFKVKIIQEGNYSFQINQIPERTYPDKEQESHRYASATIKIGKILGNGKYQEFQGSTSSYRTLFRRHTLPPGEYVVWGQIDFSQKWERDYELTLAIYADYVCEIQDLTQKDCPGFNKALEKGDAVKSQLISGGVGADEQRGGKRRSHRRRHNKGQFNNFGGNQGGYEQQQWGGNQGGYGDQGNFGGQGNYGGQGYGNQYDQQWNQGPGGFNQYGGQYNQGGWNNQGGGYGQGW